MENKMSNFSKKKGKSKKIMDYSRHSIYTCNHVEFTLFSLLS